MKVAAGSRPLMLVLTGITTWLTGCGDSHEAVVLHGRLLRADGAPAAGVAVESFGLETEDGSKVSGETDSQGRYELRGNLRGPPLPDRLLSIHSVGIDASMPARTGDVPFPDLTLWDDDLAFEELSDGAIRLTWAPVPGEGPVDYDLSVRQTIREGWGANTWYVGNHASTAYDFPAEVFEDRWATFEVSTGLSLCRGGFCVRYSARPVTKPAGELVPVSRGAVCSAAVGGQDVPLLGDAGAPCPLTDGAVTYHGFGDWLCGERLCRGVRSAVLDLGIAMTVETIVLHDLYLSSVRGAQVEISTDGQSFTQVARVEPTFPIFTIHRLDAPVMARYVRVVAEDSDILGLAELSVF